MQGQKPRKNDQPRTLAQPPERFIRHSLVTPPLAPCAAAAGATVHFAKRVGTQGLNGLHCAGAHTTPHERSTAFCRTILFPSPCPIAPVSKPEQCQEALFTPARIGRAGVPAGRPAGTPARPGRSGSGRHVCQIPSWVAKYLRRRKGLPLRGLRRGMGALLPLCHESRPGNAIACARCSMPEKATGVGPARRLRSSL